MIMNWGNQKQCPTLKNIGKKKKKKAIRYWYKENTSQAE